MKEKFDAYVLWPLAKKFQNWIVDQSTARDLTVHTKLEFLYIVASPTKKLINIQPAPFYK